MAGRDRTKSTVHDFINSAPSSGPNDDDQLGKPRGRAVTSFTSPKTRKNRSQTSLLNTDSDQYFFFCKNKSDNKAKVVLRIETNGFSWINKPSSNVCKDREALSGAFEDAEVHSFEAVKEFRANKLTDLFTLVLGEDEEEIEFKSAQVNDIVKAIAEIMEKKPAPSKKKKRKKRSKTSKKHQKKTPKKMKSSKMKMTKNQLNQ